MRDESGISSSLVDYKIWCFDGKAFGTRVYYNRHRFEADIEWYDRDWNYRPEKLVFTKDKRDVVGENLLGLMR